MIKDRQQKINDIVSVIKTRISNINAHYGKDAGLYFYTRVFELRTKSCNIESFLNNEYHIEILYATLASWGMNSRGAKMKYFDDFRRNLSFCLTQFNQIERFEKEKNYEQIYLNLSKAYKNLNLMRTRNKLVSNSKTLHFLFPNLCVPMDCIHTLKYFFGNTGESENKFLEIVHLTFEIITSDGDLSSYIDNGWNKTIPKIIDNAIILLVRESVN
jgi:hypothetical protein